jgi:diaminohydroxyphosphoribosylaminopyrimidine deaminase/5-amino-6-(5-phosphoribosylamino)uracil reductase
MRDHQDAILTGIGTVLLDDPQLNCRMHGGRDPVRVVVDSRLRLPETAAIVTSSPDAPLWIAVTGQADSERLRYWQGLEGRAGPPHIRVLVCRATAAGQVDLADLLQQLGRLEITSLLVEAGSQLTGSLLEAGLVDRLALFLAPRLIGGEGARGLSAWGVDVLARTPRLEPLQITRLGEDLLLEGSLQYP